MEVNFFRGIVIWKARNFNVKDRTLLYSANTINNSKLAMIKLAEWGFIGKPIAIYYPKDDIVYAWVWKDWKVYESEYTGWLTRGKSNLELWKEYVFVWDPKLLE